MWVVVVVVVLAAGLVLVGGKTAVALASGREMSGSSVMIRAGANGAALASFRTIS